MLTFPSSLGSYWAAYSNSPVSLPVEIAARKVQKVRSAGFASTHCVFPGHLSVTSNSS